MTTATQEWPLSDSTTFASNPPRRSRATTTEKAARTPRIPITRVEHFMLSELSSAERAKLVDDTYRISLAYFPDDDRDGFDRDFFSGDKVWVFLFYGPDGELAGFSSVYLVWVNHEGKDHAAFRGSVCIDARLPVVREALRFKLSHLRTPMAYFGMAATPSGYRLLTSSVPRVYPSRQAAMPEEIKALVLKAAEVRGYEVVDAERLLVHATSQVAEIERIQGSRALQHDPDARFYLQKNPDFDRFYMLVWAPLDLADLARGAAQMIRRHVFGDGDRAAA
jgi:hypothetical protein